MARSERGFRALFGAQFLGAFNDNLYKTALAIAFTFSAADLGGLGSGEMVAIASALMILPFLLFSALAGQLADKFAKHRLIRLTKALECAIVVLAGASLFLDSTALSLAALFLLGTQSAFFGPLKYGALPELVAPSRLVRANALIEMGTFLAILFGTIAGGILGQGRFQELAVVMLATAALGYVAARRVPELTPAAPQLKLEFGLVKPTLELIRLSRQKRAVFHSVLGISWFWLLGVVVLSVLPGLVKDHLGGQASVVTLLLGVFSVGIGLGALLCERLSFRRVELGLVPIGALGLSLFMAWVALATNGRAPVPGAVGIVEFVSSARGVWVSAAVLALALAGGIFTVPLYALLQERSEVSQRARVVAANNVMNALFMVLGSGALALSLSLGLSAPAVLGLLAILNLLVAGYTYSVVPEFLFRFLCWTLAHVIYRLKIEGAEKIPERGAALLACNHVTFIDWMIISAASQRPVRFVMHHEFLKLPATGRIFRDAKVIPIASAKEDPVVLEAAFRSVREALAEGALVCIFPEGRLTRDGELSPFRRGIERIVSETPVPVVPLHLDGLWGSFFSHHDGKALRRPFRRVWSRVRLAVGAPIEPSRVTAASVEASVIALRPGVQASEGDSNSAQSGLRKAPRGQEPPTMVGSGGTH